MSETKRIVLINGSPKPDRENSASEFLINMQEEYIKSAGAETYRINARHSVLKGGEKEDFEEMNRADAVIFTFPLYVFCLPGVLMRFLQDYYELLPAMGGNNKEVKIYAVVNCGFPEADINEEAVRVIQSFSRHIGATFRFGVKIGGGGMLPGALEAPFMRKTKSLLEDAFRKIADDILESERTETANIEIPAGVPRKVYFFFATRGWFQEARRYNLKRKALYRKPYLGSR